ncbi:MAG TPA: hypothetical protein VMZ69_07495 [Saprospiraceae bacterium]|nr:hypothetical protein [Saprospiraceae bacterium]
MSVTSSAQEVIEALPRWMGSIHVNYLIPRVPINQFLENENVGYQIEFQYRVQYNKPFLAGGYYSESGLSKYVFHYTQPSGNGDIDIQEKANTRRMEFGITSGFYPEVNWLIQPYLQGRMGVSIFQTSTILTDDDTDESLERISESTSSAPSYGLDVGFHIVPNIWYLRGDVRFGFIANTSTSYLLLNEEEAGDTGFPIDYFDTHTSAGKWLKISAGISYLF